MTYILKKISGNDVPKEETRFAIETPALTREKKTYKDVLNELATTQRELQNCSDKEKELLALKADMDKFLQ